MFGGISTFSPTGIKEVCRPDSEKKGSSYARSEGIATERFQDCTIGQPEGMIGQPDTLRSMFFLVFIKEGLCLMNES